MFFLSSNYAYISPARKGLTFLVLLLSRAKGKGCKEHPEAKLEWMFHVSVVFGDRREEIGITHVVIYRRKCFQDQLRSGAFPTENKG